MSKLDYPKRHAALFAEVHVAEEAKILAKIEAIAATRPPPKAKVRKVAKAQSGKRRKA